MTDYDKEFTRLIEEEEEMQQKVLNAKIDNLNREFEIRSAMGDRGFKKINPDYEYENDPVYLEHIKAALRINMDENIAQIKRALNMITRNKIQRQQIEEMKKVQE